MAFRPAEWLVRQVAAAVLPTLMAAAGAFAAQAQVAAPQHVWIRISGDVSSADAVQLTPVDSVESRLETVVDSLRSAGYYYADVRASGDEGRGASGTAEGDVPDSLYVVSRGPLVRMGSIEVGGVGGELEARLESVRTLKQGDVFDPDRIEEDVERMLIELERLGRPLAEMRVSALDAEEGRRGRLSVSIMIDPGPRVVLRGIELVGSRRTAPALTERIAGLTAGQPLETFDPDRIRTSLGESGLFSSVGVPELVVGPDSTAVLRIPVTEAEPGSFDLVVGYLPPAGDGSSGSVIGNGHLLLHNMFGRGRRLSLRLHRLPRQVSRVDVAVSDPYVAGLPIGVEAAFLGMEQDSTYGKRAYHVQGAYHLAPGVDVLGRVRREATGPGQAGLRLGQTGRQVVSKASTWFGGLGVRLATVDRPTNPTRGVLLEMTLESGWKRLSALRLIDADTVRIATDEEQRRLDVTGRYYLPTMTDQVLVLGTDAGIILSETFDRSDLYRFGGASSLRGYDEERFLGSVVGRLLAEYRFVIDARSYAYAFFDLGYVDRPETPDLAAVRGLHPGYGIGLQFDTAVGLMNVSAALNPDSGPTQARIHAGLSFGL